MLILISLAVLFGVGYLLEKNDYDALGFLGMILGGVGFAIGLLIVGVSHLEAKGHIAHYNEVLISIENMQDANVSDSEVIVLSQKIIEVNTFLAEAKTYNNGLLDIFVPDKVAELEYIRYEK